MFEDLNLYKTKILPNKHKIINCILERDFKNSMY